MICLHHSAPVVSRRTNLYQFDLNFYEQERSSIPQSFFTHKNEDKM